MRFAGSPTGKRKQFRHGTERGTSAAEKHPRLGRDGGAAVGGEPFACAGASGKNGGYFKTTRKKTREEPDTIGGTVNEVEVVAAPDAGILSMTGPLQFARSAL